MLVAQECATGVLASEVCQMPDADHPRVIQLQQTITVVNITVNHVCRDNVEGYSLLFFFVHFLVMAALWNRAGHYYAVIGLSS